MLLTRRAATVIAVALSASTIGLVIDIVPAAAAPVDGGGSGIDLSTYELVGRYALPTNLDTPDVPAGSELATEVSAITYNWDTDSLFVVGDEGTSVVQVTKTGRYLDSMTLSAGQFEDTEGLTYVGNGQFVLAEERLRTAVLFTYVGGGELTDADAQSVKLGTTIGNIGLEGISYDPLTSDATGPGFIGVKESGPLGLFQTNIDFESGTATNGSPTTENSTNLFDPALVGTTDLSDVLPLSLLPDVDGGQSPNLLVISQESGRIVNIDRNGTIANQLDIVDAGAPLTVPAQTMEGVTVDRDGILYTTAEGGGGDATHPQLLVWASGASPLARLAVTEVAPWGSDAVYDADWFELSNTGATALDLTGVRVDDGSNSFDSSALLDGVTSLAPGQSAIFLEATPAQRPATVELFAQAWFGATTPPTGMQIGSYSGSGIGLSGSGDQVNLFAADGTRLNGVSFGAATANVTFDNFARLGAAAAPLAVATIATEGVNGAFVAADGIAIGSPGNVVPDIDPGDPGDTSAIRVTEVAAFGSGNAPYAADWIEVTNTGTASVNLTGWKMDDASAAAASGAELVGVPTLPAGASAIFFEGTDDDAFELDFAQAWFGQNLFDAGFFFGHYTGGGVGLSTGGDAVTLFDAAGNLVTGVAFGASPSAAPFATFDNTAGLGAATTPFPVLTTLSVVGTNGAFTAVDGHGLGSPGTADAGTMEPEPASVAITEVSPWSSGDAPYGADWFELTNTGTTPVDLEGWKVDDGSNTVIAAAALTGVSTLTPGGSAIFFEGSSLDAPTITATFLTAWSGSTTVPPGFQIGNYSGSGLGLSTGGDGVNVFDSTGTNVASVTFGTSTIGATFDNTAGTSGTISTLSAEGVNGAFVAADGHGVGSPANLTPPLPDLASLAITEVTPWASGDSPYASDWIEITNTGADTVDLTGYRIDDDSNNVSLAATLTGVTNLPAGATAVFLESPAASFDAKRSQFLQAWLGTTVAPAGLLIGSYSGSGIGLSTGGDQVNLFDSSGRTVTGVAFGAATVGRTFDNTVAASGAISTLSTAGVNDAFTAVDGHGLGSPGRVAWTRATVYDRGDTVTSGGKVYRALWWTSGQIPGSSPYGAWEEIATTADGTAVWTPSRIFVAGNVVTHQGTQYKAMWWTRNQTPGTPFGPWQAIVPPGTVVPFNPTTIYFGGETVSYKGRTYRAQWWTILIAPGTPWSSWKLVS